MSRYDDAKMPSLKDKIREQARLAGDKEKEKVEVEEVKITKGRRLSK